MYGDQNLDEFSFKLRIDKINEILAKRDRPTKREVLRVVISVFGPLGFLTNFVVQAKILLQEIWISEIGWDDNLNLNWLRWTEEL
jgi:hypothetical protein